MLNLIDIITHATGYSLYSLELIENKQVRLAVKAVFIAIIKEEGYRNRHIIDCVDGWNHQNINYALKLFDAFIVTDKLTKELYLKAVKAVEDWDYESKNDAPAA